MVELGQKVYVDKIYAWPSKTTYDALEPDEVIEFAPVDNPQADKVAVVVGVNRKKYRAAVDYYCYGDGGATCGSEGWSVDTFPEKKLFIEVRYSLNGGRRYTTPEFVRPA